MVMRAVVDQAPPLARMQRAAARLRVQVALFTVVGALWEVEVEVWQIASARAARAVERALVGAEGGDPKACFFHRGGKFVSPPPFYARPRKQ